jgi:thiol:disulfide interchange protein DsbD
MLIGFWPKLIQKIPKPGTWMNIFEEIMGFLLLAAVIWLLDVLYFQVGWSNLVRVMIFMVFLAIASWIYGRFALPHFSKKKQWIATIASVLVIVLSSIFVVRLDAPAEPVESGVVSEVHGSWQKFSPELIGQLRLENKPIFIDFTAKWCMTCKVNENAVLYTDAIQQDFKNKNVVLVKADYTNKDEVIGQWLQMFGKAGVPTYVLYIPGKENPIILPEILTNEIVRNALNKLPD